MTDSDDDGLPDSTVTIAPAALNYFTSPRPHFIYAGLSIRAVAFAIDAVIIRCIADLFSVFVAPLEASISTQHIFDGTTTNLLFLIIGWAYFSIQESSLKQATLGKRWLSIKVVDMEGERITFARATGRYLGKIVSACTFFFGFLMVGWTKQEQALHDKIAKTLVVTFTRY